MRSIEIAHLNLRYAHTRIHSAKAVLNLACSIDRFGQICPVLVVPGAAPEHVLIDGYLRVEALRRCGQDMVNAEIWPDKETEALIHVLANCQMRAWDMFEQACLLNELHERCQLTQTQIARFLGKDKSWVSRRLSFLNTLPEDIVTAVGSGHISSWSAPGVLTPWARANAEHARKLADSLKKEPLSTRNLALFFDHYKKANRRARENMVTRPRLFLKALESGQLKKRAKALKAGPEGCWLKEITTVERILTRLIGQVPAVFYTGQSNLLNAFAKVQEAMTRLERTIRDHERKETDDFDAAPVRVQNPSYQSVVEGLAQYGASGSSEPRSAG